MEQSLPPRSNGRVQPVCMHVLFTAFLSGEEMTFADMAELTGMSAKTISQWIAPWRRNNKKRPHRIIIIRWTTDARGRWMIPVFAFSAVPRSNALRPKPKTGSQRGREYRRKCREKKAEAERLEMHKTITGIAKC